jgi:hypothetical protein
VADCKMIVRVVIIRQAKIFMYLLKIIWLQESCLVLYRMPRQCV